MFTGVYTEQYNSNNGVY